MSASEKLKALEEHFGWDPSPLDFHDICFVGLDATKIHLLMCALPQLRAIVEAAEKYAIPELVQALAALDTALGESAE